MKSAVVLAIAAKEIRDVLRDRRAFFVSIILPMLLYPVMIVGFIQTSIALKQELDNEVHMIWIDAPELTGVNEKAEDKADKGVNRVLDGVSTELRARFENSEKKFELVAAKSIPQAEIDELFKSGDLQLILTLPADYKAKLAKNEQLNIKMTYQKSIDKSRFTYESALRYLNEAAAAIRAQRFRDADLKPERFEPFVLTENVLGKKEVQLLRSLSMLLLILAITGAFYPALDLGAGEKERGTLETLLLTPATRMEIAAGKYLAVFAIALSSGLLNVASLAGTFANLASLVPEDATDKLDLALSLDATTALSLALVIVPLVALFSAVALSVSTYAASYKEAQNYLSPVILAVTLPAMAANLPGIKLTASMCFIPVLNSSILLRDLLVGSAFSWQVLLVVGSTAFYALLAIRFVASMYQRDDVLMRPAAAATPLMPGLNRFLARFSKDQDEESRSTVAWEDLPPELQPPPARPTPIQGLVAFALAITTVGLIGLKLKSDNLAWGVVIPALMILSVLGGLLPWLLGMKHRIAYQLALPKQRAWRAFALALCAGIALGLLRLALSFDQATGLDKFLKQGPEALMEKFKILKFMTDLGPWNVALLFGLLPALSEEFLVRGFVLNGFQNGFGKAFAVFAAAGLGAILTGTPTLFVGFFVSGLIAGALVLRFESVWLAVVLEGSSRLLFYGLTAPVAGATSPGGLFVGVENQQLGLTGAGVGLAVVAGIAAILLAIFEFRAGSTEIRGDQGMIPANRDPEASEH